MNKKTDTKLEIIKAALRLFLQKGLEKTSMNEIATTLGITKPAIYYHYKNKDAVIEGVLTLFKSEMSKWITNIHKSNVSVQDYLKKTFQSVKVFSDVTVILLDEIPDNCRYNFDELILQFSKKNITIKSEMETIFIQTRKSITNRIIKGQSVNEIRTDLNPEIIALQIHSMIEGISTIAQLDSTIDLSKVGQKLFNEFWKTIKQ